MPSKNRDIFYGINWRAPEISKGEMHWQGFHEARDISNVRLGVDGGLEARPGRAELAELYAPGHSVKYHKGNLIAAAASKIYADPGAGGSPVVSHTLTYADAPAWTTVIGPHMIYADGQNDNLKWDGTSWSKLGIAAPSAAPGVAAGAAGSLSGTFIYCYVYVYKNATINYEAESAASAFSSELTVSSKKIDISVIASSDTQVTNIRIYRRSTNSTESKLVVELSNTSTTYTDDTAAGSLGAGIEFPKEGEPLDETQTPVKLTGVVKWKNRLFGWAGRFVYHTRAGLPEKFYSDQNKIVQPIAIDTEDYEPVTLAFPAGNALLVFTRSSSWKIVGDTEPFSIYEFLPGVGCDAPRSACMCANRFVWKARDGVWMWDLGAGAATHISAMIDKDFHGKGRGLLEGSDDSQAAMAGVYVSALKEYWLSAPMGGSMENRRTFVFSFEIAQRNAGSPWSKFDDFAFCDAVEIDDKKIVSAIPNDKRIAFENTDTDDFGTSFTAFYDSRLWNGGTEKQDIALDTLTATGYTVGSDPIVFETTSTCAAATDSVNLSNGGDTWGADPPAAATDTWGADPPDAATDWWVGLESAKYCNSYPQDMICNAFGFKVTVPPGCKFYGFEWEYQLWEREYIG